MERDTLLGFWLEFLNFLLGAAPDPALPEIEPCGLQIRSRIFTIKYIVTRDVGVILAIRNPKYYLNTMKNGGHCMLLIKPHCPCLLCLLAHGPRAPMTPSLVTDTDTTD